jgi:hypothetical protein
MTHEQNIIATAVDLMVARDNLRAAMRQRNSHRAASVEFQDDFTAALDRLGTALKAAGLDWQDEATWDRLRSGQLVIQ